MRKKSEIEFLNSLPRVSPSMEQPGGPSPLEVWTLKTSILSWLNDGDKIPVLFPVLVYRADEMIERTPVAQIVPVHGFSKFAAGDDLFCGTEDGPFEGKLLATWLRKTVPFYYLDKFIRKISSETYDRLAVMLDPQRRNTVIMRDYTGPAIIGPGDDRTLFRMQLRDDCRVLGRPVEALEYPAGD